MPKNFKDDIELFFQYDISLDSKTLYMGSKSHDDSSEESGTDYAMASNIIKGLRVLDSLQNEKPITIIMNNPGGDVYHGFAIYDAIRACRNVVKIEVFGQAMSMGSIILQAADERLMSKNSRLMIHQGTTSHSNHPKIVASELEDIKKMDAMIIDLFHNKIKEKKPRFKRSQVERFLDFDTYMTAQKALEHGLIDKVI